MGERKVSQNCMYQSVKESNIYPLSAHFPTRCKLFFLLLFLFLFTCDQEEKVPWRLYCQSKTHVTHILG